VRGVVRVAGPVFAQLQVGAIVPITRYEFVVQDTRRTVFQQPLVSGLFSTGLFVQFE